jgi:UDP-N-acetylmuramoylalanine-D-glutamate ligase
MNKDASKNKAIIYGLSTEGYRIASSLAIRGMKVSLVDEAARMAITLKPEIASSYPNVSSLMDDEPLLELEPIDIAIKDASFLFFAPKIRKIGQEARADSVIKLKDAMRALNKNCSVG